MRRRPEALVAKFADKQCQTFEEETRQIKARSREKPPLSEPTPAVIKR